MIYTTSTTTHLDTIKTNIESKAKEVGFGVLHSYAFKEILHSKGFPIERDITVYELCNPTAAQQALTTLPEISVYLPCRISVYEDNGKSVLGTMGFEDMLGTLNVDEAFKTHMRGIYDTLKSIMHSFDA